MFRPYHKTVNESNIICTKIELDLCSLKKLSSDTTELLEGEYDT
jgi:hypothetical protein